MRLRRLFHLSLLVAAAYALVGAATVFLSLRFAIPSPIFPAAGVAAAAVLRWGMPILPAVFAGRLALAALTDGTFASTGIDYFFEAGLAAAVTAQAAAGGGLARRFIGADDPLVTGTRSLGLVALVGPLSCWIAPALGLPWLQLHQRVLEGDLSFVLLKWWAGDSIGAMWVVPLLHPLLAPQASAWRGRARGLVGPLLAGLLLVSVTLAYVTDRERAQLAQRFEADADDLASAAQATLDRLQSVADAAAQPQGPTPALPPGLPEGAAWAPPPEGLPPPSAGAQVVGDVLFVRLGAQAPGAWLQLPLRSLVPPDPARLFRLCYATAAQGAACASPRRILQHRRDVEVRGRLLQLHVSAQPAYAARHRLFGSWTVDALAMVGSAFFIGFLLLVTGRQSQIQRLVADRTRALASSEARLDSIYQAAGVGIVHLKPDGTVESCNPEATRQFGGPGHEVHGRRFAELFKVADQASVAGMIDAARAAPGSYESCELTLACIAGQDLRVMCRLTAPAHARGVAPHFVAVLDDLTDVDRLRSSEAARQHAERESRAKGDFLSSMSHELRTPLNAILGFTQFLRSGGQSGPDEREQSLARIEAAGWHLLEMIDGVLTLARLEAGRADVRSVDVPLQALIEDSLSLVDSLAREAGIRIDWTPRGSPGAVRGDPTQIRQALLNLLTNAVKYNRPGGVVRVRVLEGEGQWGVAVEDEGRGLSGEQLAGLFVPFDRLGQERRGIKGTGIGLAISKRLVDNMGGSIAVHSEPGQGACFTIWLPRAVGRAAGGPACLDNLRATGAGHATVLYVEDDEVNVEVMKTVLRRLSSEPCVVARTGGEALSRLAGGDIDLVLLDLGLPDLDGFAVLETIVATRGGRHPPVVVVSADGEPATRSAALAAGAAAFFDKPYDVGALLAGLRAILGAAHRPD